MRRFHHHVAARMAMMINIPSTCNDPSYQYKMPRLITKVEGRGNNIKTCIVNMGDVARALMRPPQYTTKWLGNELGTFSTYIKKEGEGERTVVNGFHEPAVIQAFLDKFIDKYVCCKTCHLPEMEIEIEKGNVMGKCRVCGWLGDLDNENKLASFIAKNPPDETGLNVVTSGADTGKALSKEERRREKIRKQARKDDDESSWYSDSSDEDKPKAAKSKKEKKEKKDKKTKKEKKSKKERKQRLPDEEEEEEDADQKEGRQAKKGDHGASSGDDCPGRDGEEDEGELGDGDEDGVGWKVAGGHEKVPMADQGEDRTATDIDSEEDRRSEGDTDDGEYSDH